MEASIKAAACQKLGVRALLEDAAIFERNDAVGALNGAEPVRNDQAGAATHQFFKRIEQLNSYLETLPCLYYSPKTNSVTKLVEPLDDSNLTTYLLRMCPIK